MLMRRDGSKIKGLGTAVSYQCGALFSATIYSKVSISLQVIYESFDCNLTQGRSDSLVQLIDILFYDDNRTHYTISQSTV